MPDLSAGRPLLLPNRPMITTDPAVRFGGPAMRGISTDAITSLFLAESCDAAAVQDDWDLTRHELLVVLWFEGTHGRKKHRRLLGDWALRVAYPVLAGWDRATKIDELALPEIERRAT